jgi:hypothetical protein
MKKDIEIAQEAKILPIAKIADKIYSYIEMNI